MQYGKFLALALGLGAGFAAATALADQGVTDDTVTFAQVAAMAGPAAALGTGMQTGIKAAFDEANAAGGVNGRKLVLDTFDDGYEPDRSVAMVKDVIASDKYIALIGPVGTPTTQATQPITTDVKMPVIGPFTGAGFLRNAALGNIFNVRASYSAETEAWIKYLVDDKGMKKIALLYQDDAFGRAGRDGVTKALEKRKMTLVAEGNYTRNTVAVKTALLDIRKAEPDAVVMVGAYKPVAEFIRLSHQLKFTPTFVNISFVGSEALAAELGKDGTGVIISQVVPFPWDTRLPVVAAYQAALKAEDGTAKPSFVSLEGYLAGRLAIAALKAAGPQFDRAGYLAALAGLHEVDLGGVKMEFGPADNQGLDDVFLTRITDTGGFEPVTN